MKSILTFIILVLNIFAFGQENIAGKYNNSFGSKLTLNEDNTYFYIWHFDLSSSWSTGVWEIQNDTVYLTCVPIYDTIIHIDTLGNSVINQRIELSLSADYTSEIITEDYAVLSSLSGGGQNRINYPTKFVFHRDRLFEINNNRKLKRKKVYCIFRQKRFSPYYKKVYN